MSPARWSEFSEVVRALWLERPEEVEHLLRDAKRAWSAGQRCEVVDRPRHVIQHEPRCPGPDCLACMGSFCELCGAGGRGRFEEGDCEHDVLERHLQPADYIKQHGESWQTTERRIRDAML